MMCWYRYDAMNNLLLTLHIQTGAKRTEAVGMHGDALKLRLAAAPIEGQANKVLRRFIAQCFNVPINQVLLKQGEKSRRKLLVVKHSNCDPDVLFDEKRT